MIPRLTTFSLFLAACLLGVPARAQTKLWVVDDDAGAGVDFADIQSAVDVAQQGDGVLVRAGSYAAFEVDGKALRIVGEVGAVVDISGASTAVLVSNVPAGSACLLVGLDVALFGFGAGVVLEDNPGTVWIEDCQLRGGLGRDGLRVARCDSVVVTRCVLVGGTNAILFSPPEASWHGLRVEVSSVHVYESVLEGGDGGVNSHTFVCDPGAGPGGNGAMVESGHVFLSGCTVVGRDGEDGGTLVSGQAGKGTAGGDGLHLESAATAKIVDCTITAGAGSFGTAGCGNGPPGTPIADPFGGLTSTPGTARSLASVTPLKEGALGALTFVGDAGDLVFLSFSQSARMLPLPGVVGPLLTGFPGSTVFIGVLGPAGQLAASFTVGTLPSGFDQAAWFLQAGFVSSMAEIFIGGPTALVILDSTF